MMRVLHVSSGHIYGGIETVLVSLAGFGELFPELEHHFALCFEGRLSDELRALEVPVYMLGKARLGRPLSVPGARKALRSVIEQSSCEVVICHGPRSMILFTATVRAAKRPLVMWVHGVRARRQWLNWLLRRVPPDLAICNSEYTQEALTSLFPLVDSTVIYNPLSMDTAQKSDPGGITVRDELDTPSDAVVIVQVGRMVSWKGHTNLIDALASLDTGVSWRCWIVGGAQSRAEESYFRDLELRVQNQRLSDHVQLVGQRSDIPRILEASDIFCQPNQKPEPFGVVFIEAMLAGLPVVTSAMGAAIEVVNRESGVLVPPNDQLALTRALHNLVTDSGLRQRVSIGGPAQARHLCEPAARLNELRKALQTLVNSHQLS